MADDFAVEDDFAVGRAIQATEQLEQRALARARRPHQSHELTATDPEGDAPQRIHVTVAEAVALGQVARLEDHATAVGVARDGCGRLFHCHLGSVVNWRVGRGRCRVVGPAGQRTNATGRRCRRRAR